MAKLTQPQPYPRVEDENDTFQGYLDESKLHPHINKLSAEVLRKIIISAIENANSKSSRAILNLSEDMPVDKIKVEYRQKGIELFKYFIRYCGDPAATAHQCYGRHYSDIAREQFRNRTLQKERMNSGWRYQYIARDAALASQRFISVSDIGAAEADFNAIITQKDSSKTALSIYVSIKNRINTMGGQDWPKAILALEGVAQSDKNRSGPYICVFGIAMEGGLRSIRAKQKTRQPYSVNTEIWLSDFFWPFFSNLSYDEIVAAVVATLIDTQKPDALNVDVPNDLIDAFGETSNRYGLLDQAGCFNDAYRLAKLFVGGIKGLKLSKRKGNQ